MSVKIKVLALGEDGVVLGPPKPGMELVTETIDPEIRKFEEWFQVPERGNGPLTRLERDLLRSYLYQKLMGVL